MSLCLMTTHPLAFTTPTAGSHDANRDWVDGVATTLNAIGSLQSFRSRNTTTKVLPEGLRTDDIRVYFTTSDIPLSDEFKFTTAASTLVNGKEFYAFDREDNTGYGLVADHYKYYLIRKPLNSGGSW